MLSLARTNNAQGSQPLLSVVIVIRNRADELVSCLASLEAQFDPPYFEVIIVDDGSQLPVNADWQHSSPAEIRVVHQSPQGIAAARNFGVTMSRGRWIMFIDSDCEVCPHTLREVAQGVTDASEQIAFQLKLVGGRSTFVERMEDVRLVATQCATSEPDGHIHYLATGGFVIHGGYARFSQPLFDPRNVRSEDSFLLAQLTSEDNLPVLLNDAVVQHKPRLTTLQYTRKHFWMGYRSIAARRALQKTGHTFITGRSRYSMVGVMIRHARAENIPLSTVWVLLMCHLLNRMGRVVGRVMQTEATPASAPVPATATLDASLPQSSAAKSSVIG